MQCPQCDHSMIFSNGINLKADCKKCLPGARCVLQSEEVMLAPMVDQMADSNAQTTNFLDTNVGTHVGKSVTPLDYEVADAQVSADLSKFLSRPVRIANLNWSQGYAVGTTMVAVRPWQTFLQNATIKNKLQNFAFLRGNLKIKIVTNGSPFLYGLARAVWNPMDYFKAVYIGTSSALKLIPKSQLPGVYITPAHSEGAEMTLPFIWPRSFLRVGVLNDTRDMGNLEIIAYSNLKSANGTTSGVSVQIYAWMEDVVLAGPTVAPALQSDEYGEGVVSAPASAIAAVARKLSDVPVIGKFAKATEIGASATSNIAKLFGFTNVPVISDTQPFRNSPFPQISSSEIGYPNDKLALDAKNELSIDPTIVGVHGEDELSISNFAKRESFLCQTTWSTSSTVDTPLFTSQVQPQLGVSETITGGTKYWFVPMGLLSTMFRNWRGDIIFRFKFVSSPFHKGRVRISYDPYSADVQTVGDTGPYTFNKIVDLGAETDVEMRIPYQQALPWCYNTTYPSSNDWSVSTTPAVTYNDTFCNGILSMKVLTTLTAPVQTSDVAILVYVRGAENMQFANPTVGNYDLTPFSLQADEYREGPATTFTMGEDSSPTTDKRLLVNFGESVQSLRTLLRRQNLLDTVYVPAPTASTVGTFRINQTRLPIYYGYDSSGWNQAKGTITPANNYAFNFCQTTPWHLISNCFLAQRGSFIWTYNPTKASMGIVSRVSRYNYTFPGMSSGYYVGTATSSNIAEANIWKNSTATNAGASLTHTHTTNGHSVVSPSFTPFKFLSTDPVRTSNPGAAGTSQYDGSVYDTLVVEYPSDATNANLGGAMIERYFGVGADYGLYFFLACPPLHYLVSSTVVPS